MELYRYFKGYVKDKYYDELLPLPAPIRKAMIFKHICALMPIKIEDGDLIAGRYGITDEPERYSHTQRDFPFENALSDDEIRIKKEFLDRFAINVRFDKGHFCADYGRILSCGLKSYEKRVREELSLSDISEEKHLLLEAMLISFDAARIYASRFASLAEKMYAERGEAWLLKIKNALDKVPYEPAESIYEAIVAVWTMHSLIPISDDSWASISLGRMDSYLYPFYKKSLELGESRENVKQYLKCLFSLLNSYGDAACALNVGGASFEGDDETNELTYLIIEVEKECRLPSPILAVRVHDNTPDELLDSVIDKNLFTIGQPTFYGENPCRLAVTKRGIPPREATNFTVNSCMGLYMCGEEIASMWGCVFNMHLPLELAVCGEPLFHSLPITVSERKKDIDCLDALLSEYEKYLDELLSFLFEINRKNAVNCARSRPNPFLSAMTAGCVERGLDRAVGARYNTETVETMALVNTANAIAAIDTLVFREKKYTLTEIVHAARANYAGCENLRADIKRCEKYGAGSRYADGLVLKLCEITSKICKTHSKDNVLFLPSLHTLDYNVKFGEKLYATLDARLAGEPVAKNAGPTNEARTSDPTSLIISAGSIHQELFSGGQPIDLYFDTWMLDSEDSRRKIATLIKTYFKLGGLQLQVNSIDVKLLEAAYEHPEGYPELVVRIGGYSLKFTELDKAAQREFIERFKKESTR